MESTFLIICSKQTSDHKKQKSPSGCARADIGLTQLIISVLAMIMLFSKPLRRSATFWPTLFFLKSASIVKRLINARCDKIVKLHPELVRRADAILNTSPQSLRTSQNDKPSAIPSNVQRPWQEKIRTVADELMSRTFTKLSRVSALFIIDTNAKYLVQDRCHPCACFFYKYAVGQMTTKSVGHCVTAECRVDTGFLK